MLGIDVRSEDFLAAPAAEIGPVDVTVMWDVIEHLQHPDRFVARVSELSRPGALLSSPPATSAARWRDGAAGSGA